MKEQLIKTINELKEVLSETKLSITHSELLDFAVRLCNTEQINKSKNTYNNLSKKLNNELKEPLATDKQVWALKRAKKTIPEGLTKKQAFEMIKELKK